MTRPPVLTDRPTLDRNRAKASAGFLHDEAAREIKERLTEVNRSFRSSAIVTGFRQFWVDMLPGAQVVDDADLLSLLPGSHDLVIHALSLHWANDPVGQLVQCRRALKPDGMFIAVLFAGQTLAELRACLGEAEARETGGLSPRIVPMGEIRDLGGLLQRAGFALPVADSSRRVVTYATPRALMRDLRAMGEANALAGRLRRPTASRVFAAAERLYTETYGEASGAADGGAKDGAPRVRATFEMVFLTGWAPADSQPKALRPGSASQRLADALGAVETALPDQPASGRAGDRRD